MPADWYVIDYPPFAWLVFFAVSWLVVWGTYWTVRAIRPTADLAWPRLLGMALVAWPFVHLAYDLSIDIFTVVDPDSVVGAVPADVWWLVIQRRAWQYLLVPAIGLYLAFGQHERPIGHVPFRRRLRRTLQRVDSWPRRDWTTDIMHGLWLFVAVLVFYVLLSYALLPVTERLETGDESAVFMHLTPALAVGLAIIAGTTEEFLFRGILQTRLRIVMPVAVAVFVQAAAFGLIHAGYGTWSHILLPFLLGLVFGAIAIWSGVIPLIIVHTGIDLVLFLVSADANGYTGSANVAVALIPLALLPPFIFFTLRWVRKRQEGPPPEGPPPTRHNP